jgi:hypothetical protein
VRMREQIYKSEEHRFVFTGLILFEDRTRKIYKYIWTNLQENSIYITPPLVGVLKSDRPHACNELG